MENIRQRAFQLKETGMIKNLFAKSKSIETAGPRHVSWYDVVGCVPIISFTLRDVGLIRKLHVNESPLNV